MEGHIEHLEVHIEQLKLIAEKSLKYNIDINQHIISCRMSLVIIKEQQQIILDLKNKLKIIEEKFIRIKEEIDQ